MPDNIRNLYNNLVKDNYDLPPYEQFVADMKDPAKLRRFHGNLQAEYSLPDFETFAADMGVSVPATDKKKVGTGSVAGIPTSIPGLFPSTPSATPGPLKSAPLSEIEATAPPESSLKPTQQKELSAREFLKNDFRQKNGYYKPAEQFRFGVNDKPQSGFPLGASNTGIPGVNVEGAVDPEEAVVSDHTAMLDYYRNRKAELDKAISQNQRMESEGGAVAGGSGLTMGSTPVATKVVDTDQSLALKRERQQLEAAVKELLPQVATKGLDPTKTEDIREAGWRIREMSEPEKVKKERRYQEEGLYESDPGVWRSGYSPLARLANERAGLSAFQEATQRELEVDPDNAEAQKNQAYLQRKQEGLINEHPEAKEQLLRQAIGDAIYEDLTPMETLWYTVTKDRVRKAAKKLGISPEMAERIDPQQVPGTDPLQRLAGSFMGTLNGMGNLVDRAMRLAGGESSASIDVGHERDKDTWEQYFGEADVAKLIQPGTLIKNHGDTPYAIDNPNAHYKFNPVSILNTTADVTGQIAAYALGTKGLGAPAMGAGLSVGAAHTIGSLAFGFTSSLEDNLIQSRDIIDDPAGQAAYAVLQSAKTAAIELLVPDAKYFDNFAAIAAKDATSFNKLLARVGGARNLTRGDVDGWVRRSVGDALVGAVKEGGEEVLDTVSTYIIDAAFNPTSTEGRSLGQEALDTFVQTAVGSVAFGGAGEVMKNRRESKMIREALYHAGTTPETYVARLNAAAAAGEMSQEDANRAASVVNKLGTIVGELEGKKYSKSQKERLAVSRLVEALAKKELDATTDPVEQERLQQTIDAEQETRRGIIDNPEPETNAVGDPVVPTLPAIKPEEVMSEDEFNGLKVGDPISMETADGRVVEDEVAEVTADGIKTKGGVIRDVASTDPANEGIRLLSKKVAGDPAQKAQDAADMSLEARIKRFEYARDNSTSEGARKNHQRMIDKLTAQLEAQRAQKNGVAEATPTPNNLDTKEQITGTNIDNSPEGFIAAKVKAGKLKGMNAELAQKDPNGFLQYVAEQAQGISEDGTEVPAVPGVDNYDRAVQMFGDKDLVDFAISKFPKNPPPPPGAAPAGEALAEPAPAGEAALSDPAPAAPAPKAGSVPFDLNDVRRPNGSIGTQGISPETAISMLQHLGINVPQTESLRAIVDYLKGNPAELQKLIDFTNANPIQITELPDGTWHLDDGNHRATLLYHSGVETVPAEINDAGKYNDKYKPAAPAAPAAPAPDDIDRGLIPRSETNTVRMQRDNVDRTKHGHVDVKEFFVPEAIAREAYDAYNIQEKGNNRQSYETILRRGGFSMAELDTLVPDWKERIRNGAAPAATPAPAANAVQPAENAVPAPASDAQQLYMDRLGITAEDYANMSEAERQDIDSKWQQSPDARETAGDADGDGVSDDAEKGFEEEVKTALPAPPHGKQSLWNVPFSLEQDAAEKQVSSWMEEARRIGREEDRSKRVVISLFDYTGNWSQPYVDAGYTVLQIDVQHPTPLELVRSELVGDPESDDSYQDEEFAENPDALDVYDEEGILNAILGGQKHLKIGGNLLENPFFLQNFLTEELTKRGYTMDTVLSATPCTTFAGSGAQHWPKHDKKSFDEVANRYGHWAAKIFDSPNEYNMVLAEVTMDWFRVTGAKSTVMENPVGRIGVLMSLPEPTLQFNPSAFGDPYTKKTQLWGNFNPFLPLAPVEPTDGSKIHKLSSKQKIERSATPLGFAYSFFIANTENRYSDQDAVVVPTKTIHTHPNGNATGYLDPVTNSYVITGAPEGTPVFGQQATEAPTEINAGPRIGAGFEAPAAPATPAPVAPAVEAPTESATGTRQQGADALVAQLDEIDATLDRLAPRFEGAPAAETRWLQDQRRASKVIRETIDAGQAAAGTQAALSRLQRSVFDKEMMMGEDEDADVPPPAPEVTAANAAQTAAFTKPTDAVQHSADILAGEITDPAEVDAWLQQQPDAVKAAHFFFGRKKQEFLNDLQSGEQYYSYDKDAVLTFVDKQEDKVPKKERERWNYRPTYKYVFTDSKGKKVEMREPENSWEAPVFTSAENLERYGRDVVRAGRALGWGFNNYYPSDDRKGKPVVWGKAAELYQDISDRFLYQLAPGDLVLARDRVARVTQFASAGSITVVAMDDAPEWKAYQTAAKGDIWSEEVVRFLDRDFEGFPPNWRKLYQSLSQPARTYANMKAEADAREKSAEQKLLDELAEEKRKLKELLRKPKMTMGGLDPETLAQAMRVLSVYTKIGYHRFREMIRDLLSDGTVDKNDVDAIRAAYGAYYNTVPKDVRAKMDTIDEIDLFYETELPTLLNPAPAEERNDEEFQTVPVPSDAEIVAAADADNQFIDFVKNSLRDPEGKKIGIVDMRRMAKELGLDYQDTHLQELAEMAVIEEARLITGNPRQSDEQKMSRLQVLYERQPTISMRSANRVALQQYSTPVPYAFTAGMWAASLNPDYVLEPSAGNGMLTIYMPQSKVIANEIDPVRLQMLQRQGFAEITNQDANKPFNIQPVGGLIMNPPFGGGVEQRHQGYRVAGLDKNMAINALKNMRDDGRAAIIIGGHNKYNSEGQLGADRTFFNFLNHYYNVVDVINVDGDLYAKQGTKFPTRLILINGRKATPNGAAPLHDATRDAVVKSFDELYNRINNLKNLHHATLLQSQVDVRSGQSGLIHGENTSGTPIEGGTTGTPGSAGTGVNTAQPANGRQPGGTDIGDTRGGSSGQTNGGTNGSGSTAVGSNGQLAGEVSTRGGGRSAGGLGAVNPQGGATSVQPGNVVPVSTVLDSDRIAKEKLPYVPRNGATFKLNSVVPTQMVSETERVLDQIAAEVGGIDGFVQHQLGYGSLEDMYKAFSAEQIDAVAMGIVQAQKGYAMIIGDQTGIGKGRIAAGMIRWAVRAGYKPVFLTEKPNLFSDLYRDLINIGAGEVVPFIMNDKDSERDPTITDSQGNILHKPKPKAEKAAIYREGRIPEDADFMMSTYSQFADAGPTTKKEFLTQVMQGNIFIMDESHNAGGESNTGAFFQSIIHNAKGGMYLSATFAKKHTNMPVYAVKTAMQDANMSHEDLVNAIAKGGVALQEVVSAQLVESGQMLRRERDMGDVKIDYEVIGTDATTGEVTEKGKEQQKKIDQITEIMRDMIEFQRRFVQPIIKNINKEIKAEGEQATTRQGTDRLGVANVPFASKVFNVVHQVLFALKVDEVADMAIEELKAGRKPVIGFNSTMESFIVDTGLTPGDVLNKADFSLSLERGLNGTLRYTVKLANGETEKKVVSMEDIGPDGKAMFDFLMRKIKNTTTGIPISPIDHIAQRIEAAGYTVKEMTGRQLMMRRGADGKFEIGKRKKEDKDKKAIAREFMHGKLDVVMLNRSGSTGISLHASLNPDEATDLRQRVMIIPQLELNVDTEMQKRGRIDRTHQAERGAYRYVVSSIPAESRLLMMFKAKLKSLSANTESSQQSKSADVDVVDFINKHGDQVVYDYLKGNPIMNLKMMDPLKIAVNNDNDLSSEENDKAPEKASNKVTGHIALLSSADQRRVYDELTEAYVAHIEALESTGENDLAVKVMPLEARTIESATVIEGKGGESPFGAPTILEKVDAKVLSKPLTKAELDARLQLTWDTIRPEYRHLDNVTAITEQLSDDANAYFTEHIARGIAQKRAEYQEMRDNASAWVSEALAKTGGEAPVSDEERAGMLQQRLADIAESEEMSIQNYQTREENKRQALLNRFKQFKPGRVYGVPLSQNASTAEDAGYAPGIFLGFEIGNNKDNPFRPSNIRMRFATILGSARVIATNMSKVGFLDAAHQNTMTMPSSEGRGLYDNWDNRISKSDRQTRYILTGNILQGFDYAKGGQLVSYTTNDGQSRKGILLPERWKPSDDDKIRVPIHKAEPYLQALRPGASLETKTGGVKIGRERGSIFSLAVPKSKASGGKFFLDQDLRRLMSDRDFTQTSNNMIGLFSEEYLQEVLDLLGQKHSLVIDVPKNLNTPRRRALIPAEHTINNYGSEQKKAENLETAAADAIAEASELARYESSFPLASTDRSAIQHRTIAADWTERVVGDHAGYRLNSYQDLAQLFSLYRSPLIEKTHVVYVKNGVVVGNQAITKNSASETYVWEPGYVAKQAALYGADEVFLVHNHPSGNPQPSQQDELVTAGYAAHLGEQGIRFSGHVILNGNRFGFIDGAGKVSIEQYVTPPGELFHQRYQMPSEPDAFRYEAVNVADYILKQTQGQRAIVAVDADGRIAGYDVVAPNASPAELAEAARQSMKANGATNYFVVGENRHPDLPGSGVELPYGMLGEVTTQSGVGFPTEYQVAAAPAVGATTLQTPNQAAGGGQAATQQSAPYTVEIERNARVKAMPRRMKMKAIELFAVGGGIPEMPREFKEREIGYLNEWKAKARHIARDFQDALKQDYGREVPKRFGTGTVKVLGKLDEATRLTLDKALKGDQAARNSLPPQVGASIDAMRAHLDHLTEKLIESGRIPREEDIQDQIDERTELLRQAGVDPAGDALLAQLQFKLEFARKIKGNMGKYVNRAYLKWRVRDWKDKVPQEKIDAAVDYLYNEALLQGRQLTQEKATKVIESILTNDSIDHVMDASKFGIDLSILKKMKDIPEPIRDLMGEVKDAEWNFMNTAALMAGLLERHKFLDSVAENGEGSFFERTKQGMHDLLESQGVPREAQRIRQINQPTWGPLHGVWTTEELADALEEWDGQRVTQSQLMKTWRDANGLAKAMKTTFSWVSELRNLLGNVSLTAFNGNFNPLLFRQGLLAIGDVFNRNRDDDARAFIEKMHRLRIVGTSLPVHEIRGMINEITATLPDIEADGTAWQKAWSKLVAFKNRTGEVYGATDDIYKIMTWVMERRALEAAYAKMNETRTEDELDREAADITLRIMPTFSKTPQIVKKMAYDFPFFGTFISYPTELMRTTYNSLQLSVQQMRSPLPEIRKMGARRFAAQLAVTASPYLLAHLVGMLARAAGAEPDDEEKEAILALVPDFYRNENVVVFKTAPGKYKVWFLSGLDGHSYLREVFNAAIRKDEGRAGDAIKSAAEPYWSQTLVGAKVGQWYRNKDQWDRDIVNEMDSPAEKAAKWSKHFGDAFTPQTGVDVAKLFGDHPENAAIKLLSGQSVMEIDVQKAMGYKLRELKDQRKDINKKASSDKYQEAKTPAEIQKWRTEEMKDVAEKARELARIRAILK